MFYSAKLFWGLIVLVLCGGVVCGGNLKGDISGDGVVDAADLLVLAEFWLDADCGEPNCAADLDGVVGVALGDLAVMGANWKGLREIDRNEYADRLRALWLGECIANWTGLQTQGNRNEPPFYDDSDWGDLGFVLDDDPWGADDDTDIEYVYCSLMSEHQTGMLSAEQIRDGWVDHINDYIWVSDRAARELMDDGYLPPMTGSLALNVKSLMIDAQLTTEIFGAFGPGMPRAALEMADLPIRTVATGYAAHASQYFVLLYCLAGEVDERLEKREQILWLADEARRYIPDSSKSADIYDFVRADYIANGDRDDWESTRDKIYERYQGNAAANGFRYQAWYESSVNFAAGVMALLYGEGDYRRTVRIGTLAGWDSDNPTATLGGLLGLMYGYDALVAEFPEQGEFSDRYWIDRTRDNMPDYLPGDNGAEDTFTMLAARMVDVIDGVVEQAGGVVDEAGNKWLLPAVMGREPLGENPLERIMERSANCRVRMAGGTVTAESSVTEHYYTETEPGLMCDGFEHDYEGREWEPSGEAMYYSSDQPGDQPGALNTFSVMYDREVEVGVVRFIEGAHFHDGGWFVNALIEVEIDGAWQEAAVVQGLDEDVDYQVIDHVLPQPMMVTGIRISGVAGGVDGFVNCLEFDALRAEE